MLGQDRGRAKVATILGTKTKMMSNSETMFSKMFVPNNMPIFIVTC